MPLYEYKCDACGIVFEARQKFSDAPLSQCRTCGGPVKKLISQTGFALKGGGWYEQGYGGKSEGCSSSSQNEACSGCPKAASS